MVADDELASTAESIRELDEAVTRRQYGYASVDDYYASASSDQRLGLVKAPLLCMNAYDDPIAPGSTMQPALANAKANPNVLMAITAHGGHLGWVDQGDALPWGGPGWVERAVLGFLEATRSITSGVERAVQSTLAAHPDCKRVIVTGHSLGAAMAVLLDAFGCMAASACASRLP